jgi:hypothetical protein
MGGREPVGRGGWLAESRSAAVAGWQRAGRPRWLVGREPESRRGRMGGKLNILHIDRFVIDLDGYTVEDLKRVLDELQESIDRVEELIGKD